MSGARISSLVHMGLGIAGRVLGVPHDHYRPSGPLDPLRLLNRRGSLLATFDARPSYNFQSPAMHNDAMRYALVDGREVEAGDYLVGPKETIFIAAKPPLQPIVCVGCNAILSLRRHTEPDFGAIDEPVRPGGEVEIMRRWPASMVYAGRGGGDDMTLPGDAPPPQFTVLLPAVPGMDPPRAGDVLVDERGRRFAVVWQETSSLGWRMGARHLAVG